MPQVAKERMVVKDALGDERMLFAEGTEISDADAELYGIKDGRLADPDSVVYGLGIATTADSDDLKTTRANKLLDAPKELGDTTRNAVLTSGGQTPNQIVEGVEDTSEVDDKAMESNPKKAREALANGPTEADAKALDEPVENKARTSRSTKKA